MATRWLNTPRKAFQSWKRGGGMSFSTIPEEKTQWAGIFVFSSVSLTAGGLFVWQSKRYLWKKDFIKQLEDRTKEPPIPLTSSEFVEMLTESVDAGVDAIAGRRVVLTGEFDHNHELILGPRAAPPGLVGDAAQGMATNPQGYFVITPLKVHDKLTILVNRGWVSRTAQTWDRPTGRVTLIGLVTEPEKGGSFAPVQDEKQLATAKLLWLDKKVLATFMQQLTGSSAVWLFDAVGDDDNGPSPRDGPFAKRVDVLSQMFVHPATHLSYAATWLTLCIAGFAMTYYRFRKSPRAGVAQAQKLAKKL